MITPLGKNVTAVIVEHSNVTKSGLYLADGASKALAPKIAKIVAVGDEITKVKPEDQVVFKPYATYEVKADDVEYVMLEEEDILGVITE
jgi:chaperonin GroES